jgi:hypothetical protein
VRVAVNKALDRAQIDLTHVSGPVARQTRIRDSRQRSAAQFRQRELLAVLGLGDDTLHAAQPFDTSDRPS